MSMEGVSVGEYDGETMPPNLSKLKVLGCIPYISSYGVTARTDQAPKRTRRTLDVGSPALRPAADSSPDEDPPPRKRTDCGDAGAGDVPYGVERRMRVHGVLVG